MKKKIVIIAVIIGCGVILFNLFLRSPKEKLNIYELENLKVKYSKTIVKEEMELIAKRTKRAMEFYQSLMPGAKKMSIEVYLLDKLDWDSYSNLPYGMPHTKGSNGLIMAFENNDFWRGTVPKEGEVSPEIIENFKSIYGVDNGEINIKKFFDYLALHELGHLIATENNSEMPTLWLNEFYANYFLQAYVATIEPENIKQLTYSPQINLELLKDSQYKSLANFDLKYSEMTPLNYSWYQSNFHMIAQRVYEDMGNQGVVDLINSFKNKKDFKNDDELIDYLKKNINESLAEEFKTFGQ